MKTALAKFALDLATAGIAGACGVLALTNLDVTSPKVLVVSLLIGALNGVVNAARRYAAVNVVSPSASTPAGPSAPTGSS